MIHKAALDTATYFAALVANRAVGLLLLPVYSRLLTPDDYGILQFYSVLGLVLGLLIALGLDSAIYLLVLRLDDVQFRAVLRSSLLYIAIVPPLLLGTFLCLGKSWFHSLFPDIPWSPYIWLCVGTSYFSVPIAFLTTYYRGLARATMFLWTTLAVTLIPTGCSVGRLMICREGARSVLEGQLAGVLLVSVGAIAVLLYRCGPFAQPFFDFGLLRRAFFLGVPYLPHLLCAWILNSSDRWILARDASLQDLGVYGMAYTLGMSLFLIGQALMGALGPIYGRGLSQAHSRSSLPLLLRVYVLAAGVGWLGIALFSREFFLILTRPAYYAAAEWSPWIALGYLALVAVSQPHQMVIEYQGRTWLILLCSGPAAVFNVSVNVAAIPFFGAWAAVASTIGSFALQACLAVLVSRRLDRLPYPWLGLLYSTLICLTAYGFAATMLAFDTLWVSLVLKLGLLAAVSMLLCMVLGMNLGHGLRARLKGVAASPPDDTGMANGETDGGLA